MSDRIGEFNPFASAISFAFPEAASPARLA
jgi:hypothetical protein